LNFKNAKNTYAAARLMSQGVELLALKHRSAIFQDKVEEFLVVLDREIRSSVRISINEELFKKSNTNGVAPTRQILSICASVRFTHAVEEALRLLPAARAIDALQSVHVDAQRSMTQLMEQCMSVLSKTKREET